MAEGLTLGLRDACPGDGSSSTQLRVAASADVYGLAVERDAGLEALFAVLTGQHTEGEHTPKVLSLLGDPEWPGGLSFAVDAAAIGRAKLSDKLEHLRRINKLIGGLAAAYYPQVADQEPPAGETYLEAYHPTWDAADGFAVVGHVRMPLNEVSDEMISAIALRRMRELAATLNCYGIVRLSTGPIRAEVDRDTGIELRQSSGSSMHAPGADFRCDDPVVRLAGDNVISPHEPLIYLAGTIALAQAPQLAAY